MTRIILAAVCIGALCCCAWLSARPEPATVEVPLRLVDADAPQRSLAGIVRITAAGAAEPLSLDLPDRLLGLTKTETLRGWYVLPTGGATVKLPRAALRLEALVGLESRRVQQELDLTKGIPEAVAVPVPFLFRPERLGLVPGNTHLHVRKLGAAGAARYLRHVPAADGLKIVFTSYLERARDDAEYDTNQFPAGPLDLSREAGVVLHQGEEYRHNFEAFGQGYGHVMFLNLRRLVKPASLGPGITAAGFDDTPLQPVVEDVRRQGGTVIWCHNTNGFEATPHALAGRLDALNVFDGSRTGNYADRYYRYLNLGLRLPISTGTDWFLYDFSRVYARLPGELSASAWLDAVRAGRNSVSNGPLLTLTVNGREVGTALDLAKPQVVKVVAEAQGRHDFQQLQLVFNGKVVKTQAAAARDGGFAARFEHDAAITEPGWLALRIDATTRNELDQPLFAHTSPVYVDLAGQAVFDPETARALLRELEQARAEIKAKGTFSNPTAADKLLALYDAARQDLTRRIERRGKGPG